MQITHEEARRYIQFNMDHALDAAQTATLFTHLEQCFDCRTYAEELRHIEEILVPVMKQQWDRRPLPLLRDALGVQTNSKRRMNLILTTRRLAIGAACLIFFFGAWQFVLSSGGQSSNPLPVGMPPVPTPSLKSTSTKIARPSCERVIYVVQEDDSLESIAGQFSLTMQEIMAANHLKTETLRTAMEIVIPICDFTPTGTMKPTVLATNHTPFIDVTTLTPDG